MTDQLNQSRLARHDLTNNAAWMGDQVIKKQQQARHDIFDNVQ